MKNKKNVIARFIYKVPVALILLSSGLNAQILPYETNLSPANNPAGYFLPVREFPNPPAKLTGGEELTYKLDSTIFGRK